MSEKYRPYHAVIALAERDACILNGGSTLKLVDLRISHARLTANGEPISLRTRESSKGTSSKISNEHEISYLGKENGYGLFDIQGATEFPTAHFPVKPETNYPPRRIR